MNMQPSVPAGVRQQLDAVIRAKRPALIAALTRAVGPRHLELVETALQDACLEAAEAWPNVGVPERPDAWLITVARNRALDALRRSGRAEKNAPVLQEWESGRESTTSPEAYVHLASELRDDTVRMMFVSCHPCNSLESQVALTLRSLCGMDIDEIARALRSDSQAVAKRLVRARQNLREAGVEFDLPNGRELLERLPAVMKVIYLLFNEGYSSLRGTRQIRRELCEESIRLGEVLASHQRTSGPPVFALLTLMLLQASRFDARTDELGGLLTLADQDRSQWDRSLIERGLQYLALSASGEIVTEYHLQAAIAACHATAKTFDDTDWTRIIGCYESLLTISPSPIVAFNRAVAVGFGHGVEAGLEALAALSGERALADYFPYHVALGEFRVRLGAIDAARTAFSAALRFAGTEPERRFVESRFARLSARASTNVAPNLG